MAVSDIKSAQCMAGTSFHPAAMACGGYDEDPLCGDLPGSSVLRLGCVMASLAKSFTVEKDLLKPNISFKNYREHVFGVIAR